MSSLRVLRRTVPEAVLDGKLWMANSTVGVVGWRLLGWLRTSGDTYAHASAEFHHDVALKRLPGVQRAASDEHDCREKLSVNVLSQLER